MSDREQLRIVDRAIWVDRGNGSLDALTTELPIWADEWALEIVQAVNERQALPLSHRQSMQAIRDRDEAQSRAALLAEDLQDARARIAELEQAVRGATAFLDASYARFDALVANYPWKTGTRDIADTLAYLAMRVLGRHGLLEHADSALRREFTDRFEDLLGRLPEGTLEVQS